MTVLQLLLHVTLFNIYSLLHTYKLSSKQPPNKWLTCIRFIIQKPCVFPLQSISSKLLRSLSLTFKYVCVNSILNNTRQYKY